MNATIKNSLFSLALALGLGIAGSAGAAPAISKDAYRATQKRIDQQEKTERKACGRLKANARDVCEAEARGKAVGARAELEARYKPSPDAERDAKETKADADYGVAKERCDDAAKGKARSHCLKQAKAAREAAVRQAKVEKVESVVELKEKAGEHGKPAATPRTPAAKFRSAKAYCEMKGTERDRCLADARRRFNLS